MFEVISEDLLLTRSKNKLRNMYKMNWYLYKRKKMVCNQMLSAGTIVMFYPCNTETSF